MIRFVEYLFIYKLCILFIFIHTGTEYFYAFIINYNFFLFSYFILPLGTCLTILLLRITK